MLPIAGEMFSEVPQDINYKLLYACDLGDLHMLKELIKDSNINLNKRFTDMWMLPGYDEKLIELEKEISIIKLEHLDFNIEDKIQINNKRKSIKYNYTNTCSYGSLLDACVRYAMEVNNFFIVDYLIGLDLKFSRCYQSFFVAMEQGNDKLIKFFLEQKLDVNKYYSQGFVGEKIIIKIYECEYSLNNETVKRILDYLKDNYTKRNKATLEALLLN